MSNSNQPDSISMNSFIQLNFREKNSLSWEGSDGKKEKSFYSVVVLDHNCVVIVGCLWLVEMKIGIWLTSEWCRRDTSNVSVATIKYFRKLVEWLKFWRSRFIALLFQQREFKQRLVSTSCYETTDLNQLIENENVETSHSKTVQYILEMIFENELLGNSVEYTIAF